MKKTTIGGMALIEGVMMIGPRKYAVAVRKPNGEIELTQKPLPQKTIWTKIPVFRGAFILIRQMVLGIKSLMYAADFLDLEDEETAPSKFEAFLIKLFGEKLKDYLIYFSVFLSIGLSIGLFILLPNLIVSFFGLQSNVVNNLIEGLLRITIFFTYVSLASRLEDMKRVWQYHGAEHKTINCYEAGEPICVENARKFSKHSPRCGTSFLFIVMIVSILVFALVGWHTRWLNLLFRLLLIPVVAGLSYEILKLVGKKDCLLSRIVSAPGMLFQLFTTKEPDDAMIEVALCAFNEVKTDDDQDRW